MGRIKCKDVMCFRLEGKWVCIRCLSNKEIVNLQEDQVVTKKQLSKEEFYFCDRCQEIIGF